MKKARADENMNSMLFDAAIPEIWRMGGEGRMPDAAALEALERYDVLDTPREEAFDRITRIVRRALSVPISTVSFLDGHRQWFKSCLGLSVNETARDISFCQIPVAEGHPLIVADTLEDPRFRENPLVLGEPKIRFYAGIPLRGANGVCIGTLCAMDLQPRTISESSIEMLVDLARIVETELELRTLVRTDPLTGAHGRRAFYEEGERAVALAIRHRYALSCVSFDLDHFKRVNDTLGHAAGDAVLVAASRTCASMLRSSDIFGRLGGEEFSILLPHASTSEAIKVAEKLRVAIAAQAAASQASLAPVTASFGVATLSRATDDLTALLAAADGALYRAKAQGRNVCAVHSENTASGSPVGRKVLKAGQIVFNLGRSTIDCTVKRLSESGAVLEVVSAANIPPSFRLAIESVAFTKSCTVAAKDTRQIEVVFG